MQILIRYGATNSQDFLDCARLLIKKGADVNLTDNKNKNALDWATKRGVLEKIQLIINESQGGNVSKHSLHSAIRFSGVTFLGNQQQL